MEAGTRAWAHAEFGHAQLGDRRRVVRLVSIANAVATNPSGIVADAFRDDAARQGAYDFLEGRGVTAECIEQAAGEACALRASEFGFVYVPLDGSTISLRDPSEAREVGPVGSAGRGIKSVNAIALDPYGCPLGLAAQVLWKREPLVEASRQEKKKADRKRPTEEREIQHWVTAVGRVAARFRVANAKAWFVGDREADAGVVYDTLFSLDQIFTIRANHDRNVSVTQRERSQTTDPRTGPRERYQHLREAMSTRLIIAHYEVDVVAVGSRAARTAKMAVRRHRLTLRIRNRNSRKIDLVPVNVLWVREDGTTPLGEQPLDWMLLTNHPIDDDQHIATVINSYKMRWRIEDFHRTWKSGGCDVEKAQLRSAEALMKWATILATVAVRIERLKHLSRTVPEQPATIELSAHELKALVFLKSREKKRTETIIPNPSIELATRWIADLGGYTGKSSGGPPGSLTIGRGMERVLAAAAVFEGIATKST